MIHDDGIKPHILSVYTVHSHFMNSTIVNKQEDYVQCQYIMS